MINRDKVKRVYKIPSEYKKLSKTLSRKHFRFQSKKSNIYYEAFKIDNEGILHCGLALPFTLQSNAVWRQSKHCVLYFPK